MIRFRFSPGQSIRWECSVSYWSSCRKVALSKLGAYRPSEAFAHMAWHMANPNPDGWMDERIPCRVQLISMQICWLGFCLGLGSLAPAQSQQRSEPINLICWIHLALVWCTGFWSATNLHRKCFAPVNNSCLAGWLCKNVTQKCGENIHPGLRWFQAENIHSLSFWRFEGKHWLKPSV